MRDFNNHVYRSNDCDFCFKLGGGGGERYSEVRYLNKTMLDSAGRGTCVMGNDCDMSSSGCDLWTCAALWFVYPAYIPTQQVSQGLGGY